MRLLCGAARLLNAGAAREPTPLQQPRGWPRGRPRGRCRSVYSACTVSTRARGRGSLLLQRLPAWTPTWVRTRPLRGARTCCGARGGRAKPLCGTSTLLIHAPAQRAGPRPPAGAPVARRASPLAGTCEPSPLMRRTRPAAHSAQARHAPQPGPSHAACRRPHASARAATSAAARNGRRRPGCSQAAARWWNPIPAKTAL